MKKRPFWAAYLRAGGKKRQGTYAEFHAKMRWAAAKDRLQASKRSK
jgi:hypothetical protein